MGVNRVYLTTIAGAAALGLLAGAANAQTPRKGGTAVVAIGADATGLNPTISTGNSEVTVGCQIYEGLTIFNAKTDLPEPALAESWTITPDGKTYTFKLRKANWHDGKPFTSEDVRFSYMEVAAKMGPTFSAQAGKLLEAVETPDPQTAVFKLKEPYGPLLRVLSCAYSGAVLPSHLFKGSDVRNSPVTRAPVGTGAFKFQQWIPGDRINVVRNDDYWDKPKPYLDGIVTRVVPNASARTLGIIAGEIDYIQFTYFPPNDAKNIRASATGKMELAPYPPNQLWAFFNLKRKPFDDVRVRKALLMATDRKYILDNIFYGTGAEGQAPWATQLPWTHDPAIHYNKEYAFDPDKAGKMLDEAGYKADANGVRLKVQIIYDASSSERNAAGLAMQSWWKRAGVEVSLAPTESAVLLPRVHQEANFDLYISSYTSYGDPAVGIARAYITSSIGFNFGNAASYSNPEVDALFDKASKLTSIEERGAVYKQIEPILMRDMPVLTLHENRGWDAASKKLNDAWTYAGPGFWPTAWLSP